MSEHTKLFERAAARYEPPDLPMDGLLVRRDRRRRNQRIAAGVVGIAVFVAAIWFVTTGPFNQSQTEGVPGGAGTGPAVTEPPVVTGPVETGGDNPEPAPLAEPAPIGTVRQSGAGCALEIVAEPIPAGKGRLRLVNERKGRVAFELVRFDPEVLTFAQLEAFVAEANFRDGPRGIYPAGVFSLGEMEVGPGASTTFTDDFTTGDAFAVGCLDQHYSPGLLGGYAPFAVVGPIVVP